MKLQQKGLSYVQKSTDHTVEGSFKLTLKVMVTIAATRAVLM